MLILLTTLACALGPVEGGSSGEDVPPGFGWTALAHDGYTACALDADGALTCWGDDERGLVSGAPEGAGFRAISVAYDACAIAADGELVCWGSDSTGLLTDVPAGTFVDVKLGGGLACVVDVDGRPTCWGPSDFTLDGTLAPSLSAFDVRDALVCGLDAAGALACDGSFGDGQRNLTPLEGAWSEVAAGGGRGCALDAAGVATCFNDRWDSHDYEIPGSGLHGMVAASTFTCALDADDRAVCAGPSGANEVTPGIPDRPLESLAAGGDVLCALDGEGELACWGESTSDITDGPR